MRENREEWYQKWEAQTRSRLLVYLTGGRKNAEAQITEDVIPVSLYTGRQYLRRLDHHPPA